MHINVSPALVFYLICHKLIIASCELFAYCDVTHVPGCWNKYHVLCQPKYSLSATTTKKQQDDILNELNTVRQNLQQVRSICNLVNFTWNADLENMAVEMSYRGGDNNNCNVTQDFKNLIFLNQTIPTGNFMQDIGIVELFKTLAHIALRNIDGENPPFSWIISPFSTQIGCARKHADTFLICVINGIELTYLNHSVGYGDECRVKKIKRHDTLFPANLTCADDLMRHFDQNYFIDSVPINYTTIKFILTKFVADGKIVDWSYDLQDYAERIVAENKCFVLERFPSISAVYYSGRQYFHEVLSKIDTIWRLQNIGNQVGCAAYNSYDNGILHFNLYCLTANQNEQNLSVDDFNSIDNIQFDHWLVYLLVILMYSNIIAALVLLHCLIKLERKRLLFTVQDYF